MSKGDYPKFNKCAPYGRAVTGKSIIAVCLFSLNEKSECVLFKPALPPQCLRDQAQIVFLPSSKLLCSPALAILKRQCTYSNCSLFPHIILLKAWRPLGCVNSRLFGSEVEMVWGGGCLTSRPTNTHLHCTGNFQFE